MLNRYETEVTDIFRNQTIFKYQLLVENSLAKANAAVGLIKSDYAKEINQYCTEKFVKYDRVKELESEVHHDIMALVLAISEKCPKAGGFVHYGATSNDIKDTVLGLQLKDSKKILQNSLKELIAAIINKTEEFLDVVCIGRTHGQHALPTTYGFKFANFLNEFLYCYDQLVSSSVNFGKISGAIGTYASFNTEEVEKHVLEPLGLQPVSITTQVLPRVIFMPFLNSLVSITGVADRFAKEIRNLQRTEIGELFEEFTSKQVGSSTMPQKRNPHKSERVSGLARVVRSLYQVGAENIALEHERDLTHSSAERIEFNSIITITHYIILELTKITKSLSLDHKNIKKNLSMTGGRQNTEKIMLQLTPFIGRQTAHKLLSQLSNENDFKAALLNNEEINKYLSLNDQKLNDLLDPNHYLGLSNQKAEKIIKLAKSKLE
ncbi:MAG: adenylosuccinate lyase [Candidatus Hodarchaeales archaeon]